MRAANAAIDAMKKVYSSNPYRWRMFEMVSDWIKQNEGGKDKPREKPAT